MAKTINVPQFVQTLEEALKEKLRNAQVDVEKVGRTNRFRFLVVSDRFRRMHHPKRQNLVWDIVEKVLPPQEMLRISMIITMSPDEVNGR